MKNNLSEHLHWLRSEYSMENDSLVILARENLERLRRGEALKMSPQLEAERRSASCQRTDKDHRQQPPQGPEQEPLRFTTLSETETPTALPMEVSFSDVPDNFFSEGDFASECSNGSATTEPVLPTMGMSIGAQSRGHVAPASVASLMHLPHPEGPLTADRSRRRMSHESETMSPATAPPTSAPPAKQPECVVPQTSKADLLAEKGRISMEICDLMDTLEGGAYGHDRADMQRKLDQLKQRRYLR